MEKHFYLGAELYNRLTARRSRTSYSYDLFIYCCRYAKKTKCKSLVDWFFKHAQENIVNQTRNYDYNVEPGKHEIEFSYKGFIAIICYDIRLHNTMLYLYDYRFWCYDNLDDECPELLTDEDQQRVYIDLMDWIYLENN